MKPILCVLGLFAVCLILFSCASDDDDNNDASPLVDDDNDDAVSGDDDSQPMDEYRTVYGFYSDVFQDLSGDWCFSPLSIHRFNGIVWDSPVDAEQNYLASDIWGAGEDRLFVAGHNLHNGFGCAMVYRYDGIQWQVQNIEQSFDGFYVNYLRSISGSSPTDVYVLGDKENAWHVDKGMIILHYDGSDWSASYLPAESILLKDLWCAPSGEVFAVGDWSNNDGLESGCLVVHNDSGTWEETKLLDNRCELKSVWGAAADDVFAAGICWETADGDEPISHAVILHYDGGQWREMDTAGLEHLYVEDISGASGQEVYLAANTDVMYQPRIYFFDGGDWSEQQQIDQEIQDHGSIGSIWATSSSELYIVTEQLDVYDRNDGSIRTIESPPLTRVWAQASE